MDSPLFFMFAEMLVRNLIIGFCSFLVCVAAILLISLLGKDSESTPDEQ